MKRPAFNASRVSKVETNLTTNNTAVTLFDERGNELTINFSPGARTRLAQFLITRAPADDSQKPQAGVFLEPRQLSLYKDRLVGTVLELLLAPQQAVHIGLTPHQVANLSQMLQTWVAEKPPAAPLN